MHSRNALLVPRPKLAILVQIAKLLIIPFVCGVEWVWLGRRFTASVIASILVVVVGVAIV